MATVILTQVEIESPQYEEGYEAASLRGLSVYELAILSYVMLLAIKFYWDLLAGFLTHHFLCGNGGGWIFVITILNACVISILETTLGRWIWSTTPVGNFFPTTRD